MNEAYKPAVLIVDDDPFIRDAVRLMLLQRDFRIAGDVGEGERVLMLCGALSPDILLLDIHLPGVDGMFLLESVSERFPAITVIMVTADNSIARVQEAISKGACGYVVKPFNEARLFNAIDAAMNRHR